MLVFAWVELVYADKDDPSQLATMALAYAAVQLVGMSLYGVEAWSRRGDAFGVYFELFARLSPLHWRDRALFTRPLLGGAPPLTPVAGHGRAAVRDDRHDELRRLLPGHDVELDRARTSRTSSAASASTPSTRWSGRGPSASS